MILKAIISVIFGGVTAGIIVSIPTIIEIIEFDMKIKKYEKNEKIEEEKREKEIEEYWKNAKLYQD